MHSIKDNLNDMDCLMTKHRVQARTSTNKGGTVGNAVKALPAKRDEERMQQVVI